MADGEKNRLQRVAFGNNLAERRKALRLSQKQLADRIGASQPSVADWEGGKSRPRRRTLQELAFALGCDTNDLLKGNNLNPDKNEQEAAKYLTEARTLSDQQGVDKELALYAGLYRAVLRVFHSQKNSAYTPQVMLNYCGGMQPRGATAAAVATKVIWDRARRESVFTSLDAGVTFELGRFQGFVDMMELPYNIEAGPSDELELALREANQETD